MSQPTYFKFSSFQHAPAPTPAPLSISHPRVNNTKPEVTTDAYCLYTTQGQIVCNKKANNIAIAPFGSEK